jgi:hypothetical protein
MYSFDVPRASVPETVINGAARGFAQYANGPKNLQNDQETREEISKLQKTVKALDKALKP